MRSNLGGPRVFRWGGQQGSSSPTAQLKPNWTLVQGNLPHLVQRWSTATSIAPSEAGTGGINLWTLIQGNVPHVTRWTSRVVSLAQSGSFGVAGVVSLTVTPAPINGIRVAGEIHASFVAGGSITVAGRFTQTGAVIATYTISPVVGFRVDGEILARFYRRAGQQAECIAGSGEPASGSTPWNAAY